MLIKLAGAVMVLSAGAGAGFLKANELARREKSLRNIQTALGILESEIVFSSHYLKHAFLHIDNVCNCGNLFSDAARNIEDMGIAKAWSNAVDKNKKRLCLKESDAQTVKILAAELGMSDREQQVKNLRHVSALLESAAEDARYEYQNSAKLYRSVGVLGGLFVIILLL